jgi:hypothetical protein
MPVAAIWLFTTLAACLAGMAGSGATEGVTTRKRSRSGSVESSRQRTAKHKGQTSLARSNTPSANPASRRSSRARNFAQPAASSPASVDPHDGTPVNFDFLRDAHASPSQITAVDTLVPRATVPPTATNPSETEPSLGTNATSTSREDNGSGPSTSGTRRSDAAQDDHAEPQTDHDDNTATSVPLVVSNPPVALPVTDTSVPMQSLADIPELPLPMAIDGT